METRAVRAEDFLIITWVRKPTSIVRDALARVQLDCEVDGDNAFADHHELQVLIDCLKAADDPYNPVHLLSLLRDRWFGFSDEELFQIRDAGGSFVFTHTVPDSLEPSLRERFTNVCHSLLRYQYWLRTLPSAVALERIAHDLGVLAAAGSGCTADTQVGILLKAIEVVRAHNGRLDSTADVIGILEECLNAKEVEGTYAMAREHGSVRVMNLHKAKGLEAPVVVLLESRQSESNNVKCHIDRSQSSPSGYIQIAHQGRSPGAFRRPKPLAAPGNWNDIEARELEFLKAERIRRLYVATTRAVSMMIIGSTGNSRNCWSELAPHGLPELTTHPFKGAGGSRTNSHASEARAKHAKPVSSQPATIAERWPDLIKPTYEILSAKTSGIAGARRHTSQSGSEYGVLWGTALHQLLDVCHKQPQLDLQLSAAIAAQENQLEPDRVQELMDTARSVIASNIWQRAIRSKRSFSELPFDDASQTRTIVRGVIDLVFEEDDGWVIVDYKSDDITASEISKLTTYYQGQLEQYAQTWQRLIGQPVKETGLYLTRLGLYVPCASGASGESGEPFA